MISVLKYLGLVLILLGVGGLSALHLLHFTMVNGLTAVPLLMVLGGAVLYVSMVKHESRY